MNMKSQHDAFEAFVRSGASPVPPSELERPLDDGSYRTSAANAGWAFWQAAQAELQCVEFGEPYILTKGYQEKSAFPQV
ncbi:hypothetical protein RBA41_31150 [Massilia sp. CCM 9210]|uniref:hypothetical protein n=1 Tax=Massilia scottii TaxID=3057166 RepID=UPI002796D20D|nr:hypothetical protein [Massilia sp. CCM 9210]MDQ1817767.1 hypothetical protein [Massilia sp. CCM 9210]